MRGISSAFFVASFLVMLPKLTPVNGAEIRSGETVVVKAVETIADDLYAFGQQITIDGTVEGDVIAFGQQITVNGTVKGNVMAAGQTVVVTGTADGARIAGQVLRLGPKAKLDGDIVAAGLSLECAKESFVGGDALFAGYQALFAGEIGDELHLGAAKCRLEGKIGGDVSIEVGGDKDGPPASAFGPPPPVPMPNVPGGLTIGDSAEIDGDLTYTAPGEAKIDPQAKLNGEVKHQQPAPEAAAPAANNSVLNKVFGRLRHVACVLIVGLAALVVLPRWSEAWAETIRTRPAMSFFSGLIGLIAFIALLIIAVIAIVVAAILLDVVSLDELVPMVVVGGVVGYAAMIVGFWIVAEFLAEALTGLALGRLAIRDHAFLARLSALIVGVLIIAAVLSIPYLGGVVGFVVMLFGLGSICLWLIGQAPPESFAPVPAGKPIPARL